MHGQAWLPARGEGYFSLTYLDLVTSDHLLSAGQPQNRGPTRLSTVTASVLYGITDRLAVSADTPYVAAKFTLTPGLLPNAHDRESTIDARYRGTFQDFHAGVRYNAAHPPL